MDLGSLVFGSNEKINSTGSSPFLMGYGANPVASFARSYTPAAGYNPALGGFNAAPTGDPAQQALLQWFLQQNPGLAQGAATGSATGAPAGYEDVPPPPADMPAEQRMQYYQDYRKNNTVPAGFGKDTQIPGGLPSLANEFLAGPPSYYPYQTVAGKSSGQTLADLNLLTYGADPNNGAQRQSDIAGYLASGVPNYFSDLSAANIVGKGNTLFDQMMANYGTNGVNPSRDTNVGDYGLQDFTGAYSENPGLTQQISGMSSDVMRALNEIGLRDVRTSGIGSGQYGSSRNDIDAGIAQRGALEEIAQQSSGMRYADFNNYLQQKLSAGQSLTEADIAEINAATNRYATEANYDLGLKGIDEQGRNSVLDFIAQGGNIANDNAKNRIGALDAASIGYGDSFKNALDYNQLQYGRGAEDRNISQDFIDADKARYDYGQTSPLNWIMQYLQGTSQNSVAPTTYDNSGPGLLDYGKAIADMYAAYQTGGASLALTEKANNAERRKPYGTT